MWGVSSNDNVWLKMVSVNGRRRVFRLLVLYRWISLVPPLIYMVVTYGSGGADFQRGMMALATAVFLNAAISLFPTQLNHALQRRPWLLLVDLCLIAGLMAVTGGWRSPYYLYALNPLMVAAFFFQLRGAMIATTVFAPLYLLAVLAGIWAYGETPDWFVVLVNIIGFYLISGTFGYAARLLDRLRATSRDLAQTNEELAAAHQDLAVLYALTTSLHSAADVEEVQEMVLTAVTTDFGCRRAVIGLVDPQENVITGWLGRVQNGGNGETKLLSHQAKLPLAPSGGLAAESVLEGRVCQATDDSCTPDNWLNTHFGMSGCLIVPLRWGLQPVGVLMVDLADGEGEETRRRSLEAIARQTAVTLGMMMTRQRRARETAVQAERARIAMDIHDSVSQSLFGIVFTLDGAIKMLPEKPEAAVPALQQALQTAEGVRREIRRTIHDIWPEEMTAEAFAADLRHYAADVLQANNLRLRFDIRGDFGALSARARRSLYRIAQEALSNIVYYAAASQASVCVDVADGRAILSIRDNGRGFEPEVALAQEHGREHFGLRGMQERARSLGGTCDIFSQPGAGTSIIIDIPANMTLE